MQTIVVTDFEDWRNQARQFLQRNVPSDAIRFRYRDRQRELFEPPEVNTERSAPADPSNSPVAISEARRVPPRFLQLARIVACHRASDRFDRLYRVLWRLTHDEPHLIEVVTDDDVHALMQMREAVQRDIHKMHAFVRFRRVVEAGKERFIAWHQPDHHIVALAAPFFARRFPEMHWVILTPEESVEWDGTQLQFAPGVPRSAAPQEDELEQLWRTYYGSIFNPARIKLQAMKREMPVRHWKTLPETELIPQLLADAPRRVAQMVAHQEGSSRSAADFLPTVLDYPSLHAAAALCQGCDLHQTGTRTVFGEGPVPTRVMLVGEQPGDSEDRAGRPFVGPAGEVLNDALRRAGLSRQDVYLTNAVKHFHYVWRGKHRLHQKPHVRYVTACQPWLMGEVAVVRPQVLVCLGATAAQAIIGRDFRITQRRGQWLTTRLCSATLATYHPSAVLRTSDSIHQSEVMGHLIRDLAQVADYLKRSSSAHAG